MIDGRGSARNGWRSAFGGRSRSVCRSRELAEQIAQRPDRRTEPLLSSRDLGIALYSGEIGGIAAAVRRAPPGWLPWVLPRLWGARKGGRHRHLLSPLRPEPAVAADTSAGVAALAAAPNNDPQFGTVQFFSRRNLDGLHVFSRTPLPILQKRPGSRTASCMSAANPADMSAHSCPTRIISCTSSFAIPMARRTAGYSCT